MMIGDHESNSPGVPYDVTSDGRRFLVNERVTPPESDTGSAQVASALTILLNFDKRS
jgi:hypothetical protein